MGSLTNAFPAVGDRVDFAAVKAASLGSIDSLVRSWLPGGRRHGDEWVVLNPTRADKKAGSFSINLRKGTWGDFATGETGGDMIDLYVYLNGCDPLEAARNVGEILGVPTVGRSADIIRMPPVPKRQLAVASPQDASRNAVAFPPRTMPDRDGKPRFVPGGESGPPIYSDELRRHVYRSGSTAVKVKSMRRGEARALIWYRVDDDGTSGWQAQKPVGFKEVPFVGNVDPFDLGPFDPLQAARLLYWPEGERDVESVIAKGGLAFTFGGTGDGTPEGCEEYARGRHLVILADNDAEGIKHAEKKAALASGVAASVKVVTFPELPPKSDVTDYFHTGAVLADLDARAEQATAFQSPAPAADPAARKPLVATPYTWVAPETLPQREFVYGRHLIRKFVSATVAPGGVGKSSLLVTEALAIVSGKALLGVQPPAPSRVWLWNLEDPHEEMARHIQATAKHFGLTAADISGRLFADSGRDQRLVTATTSRDGVVIQEPVIDNLVAQIKERGIDVLVVDPFVSSHEATENDNPAMDRIVKAWGRVAQFGNCAIELVHHARKSSAGETEITVESSRGGKALTDGCRSVRVLNRMSKEEGENAGVENPRLHFRTYIDKSNLAPPAENSDWFKLESVDLGNGQNGGYGDSVGVVVAWQWPDLMADVTVSDLRNVQATIAAGSFRANVQAADWAGIAVAEACRLNLSKPGDKRKAANLLKIWLASGALKTQAGKDAKGNERPFIVVGEWAND